MKIVIIDERNGSVLRDNAKEDVSDADFIGYVEPDKNVRLEYGSQIEFGRSLSIVFHEAVHRDVTSGEESKAIQIKRDAERDASTYDQDAAMH